MTLMVVAVALMPGAMNTTAPMDSPIGVAGNAETVIRVVSVVSFAVLVVLMAASAIALVRRYRQATGVLRLQLKWFTTAAALLALVVGCAPLLWSLPDQSYGRSRSSRP